MMMRFQEKKKKYDICFKRHFYCGGLRFKPTQIVRLCDGHTTRRPFTPGLLVPGDFIPDPFTMRWPRTKEMVRSVIYWI